jgi:hypothetical protein
MAVNLSISSFNMKQYQNIPLTLLLSAILVGALSFVIPKNKEKYLGDRFWTQKTFAPSRYNVVLMGDSRVYRGLSPSVMEEVLPGFKVLNFGYSNGGLNPAIFAAAEKKLSDSDLKKVIVLGVSANCITGYTQKNEQYIQEKSRPREDVFERLYFNGIKYHFSATNPEALKEAMTKKPLTSYYRNEYFSNGYVRSEKFPVDTMEAIPSYIQDFVNYKVEDRFVDVLIDQVEDWRKKGIIVMGFRPPTTAPMKALEDTMGLYNEELIRAKFTEAGGHWIDLEQAQYKTYDGSHLDKESAVRLSEKIAEEINYLLRN